MGYLLDFQSGPLRRDGPEPRTNSSGDPSLPAETVR
jgi:hypothetical protein